MNIYVTGIGVISAIGQNLSENLHSLKNMVSGVKPISYLETLHHDFVAGEIHETNHQLSKRLGLQNELPTRTALLGLIAAKEAIENAQLTDEDLQNIGLISATTVGGMSFTEQHYQDFLDSKPIPAFINTNDCGTNTEIIAEFFGIGGYISTINTACSSSSNSIVLGARLIESGVLDRVIVGGKDAFCRFTLNGFNSSMLVDKNYCKPFDENRRGINLGEGAAYLVLESEKAMKARKKTPIVRLSGFSNTNDAYHQTSTSPEGKGLQLSLEKAISQAQIKPEQVGYINAHGTATPNNDATEGFALKKVFGENLTFSSTKGFTGHTLAAAGAIEAVFSILSLNNQFTPPNLNFTTPIKELGIVPVTTTNIEKPFEHVVSTSIGAGGSCSTLIFSEK